MNHITQLTSPIPLLTPKGLAMAHMVIDYGMDHDLQWVTFVVATGECWTWRNQDISLDTNITMGRTADTMHKTHTPKKTEFIGEF